MINLKTLAKIAPFDEKTKESILERIAQNKLTEDQIFKLSKICWDTIFQMYDLEWDFTVERMRLEKAEGKKNYNQKDYAEEHARLINKFVSSFKAAESVEEIAEVREKLSDHAKGK